MKKLSRKRKFVLVSLVIIVIFLLSYVSVAAYNYVPLPGINSMIRYPNSETIAKVTIGNLFLEFKINSTILEEMGDLDVDVELEVLGTKNINAYNTSKWYSNRYIDEGWKLYKSSKKYGDTWRLYYSIWRKGLMVQGTVVAEGSILEKYTDYDVIIGSVLTNIISLNF